MSLILCIETGTDICSVALAKDGKMISLRESSEGRDHARNVGVFVDEILTSCNVDPEELDAIAIGKGPGSYTGLRIGVSFAKGLCYGLNIPLIAIDSLKSLCRCVLEDHELGLISAADWENTLLCPMIDARRMEVYDEILTTSLERVREVSADVIDGANFDEVLAGREMLIFGNGAAKCAELFGDRAVRLVEALPSARGLCAEAQSRLDGGEVEDIAYFEPFYLKDFVITQSKKKFF